MIMTWRSNYPYLEHYHKDVRVIEVRLYADSEGPGDLDLHCPLIESLGSKVPDQTIYFLELSEEFRKDSKTSSNQPR